MSEQSEENQLKSRVCRLISELGQLATKSAAGALEKPFAEDQANALVGNITAEIRKITDAMNRNKISRAEAWLMADQASKAVFAAKEKAKFGDTGSTAINTRARAQSYKCLKGSP